MDHGAPHRTGLNLLLLSGSENWTQAVHAAATEIGVDGLQSTSSPRDALSWLVAGEQHFSHFLLQPSCAGEWLGTLVGLTAGEEHSGTELIMLGADPVGPPHAAVIRDPCKSSIARCLAGAAGPEQRTAALRPAELTEALSGAGLRTRYQPIVGAHDRRPTAVEVLVRLDHPADGTLPPELFVPQMERSGLARALTEIVVARAFRDHVRHLAPCGLKLGLNFPLDVLLADAALTWLDERRIAAGIAAQDIVIELTERRPVGTLDAAEMTAFRSSILRLRGLGYGLAIDDVGPAMVNHRALFGLGFTALKLDRSVIHDVRFLAETIAAGKAAGLLVVAEGVEEPADWDRVRRLGVDRVQGFLVARPLPAAAVPVWLEGWQQQGQGSALDPPKAEPLESFT